MELEVKTAPPEAVGSFVVGQHDDYVAQVTALPAQDGAYSRTRCGNLIR
jgi:hypothetical protein